MVRSHRFCLLILIAIAAGTTAAQSQAPVASTPAEAALKAVRARVAPDRRLTVFDVTLEPTADGRIAVSGEVESPAARDEAIRAVRTAASREVLDKVTLLPDASLAGDIAGVVRVSVANVRSAPAHGAELVTQTLMGWPVRILKRQGGWNLVHTEPDGYLGWVEDLQLARMTAEARDAWTTVPRLVVTATHAIVRARPDDSAEPITDLVIANLLKAVEESGEWNQVELPDGRRGYVRRDAADDYGLWRAARRPTPEAIARTAPRFMGVPYLWGGTSAKGFDCSGFAKTVFHLNGIELPRDTDQQAKVGMAVTIDEQLTQLRTGDLLFFGSAATAERPERVSHVGVHVGRLEFIHASGLVRRNSLDPASPLYDAGLRRRLLHVRRLVDGQQVTRR